MAVDSNRRHLVPRNTRRVRISVGKAMTTTTQPPPGMPDYGECERSAPGITCDMLTITIYEYCRPCRDRAAWQAGWEARQAAIVEHIAGRALPLPTTNPEPSEGETKGGESG